MRCHYVRSTHSRRWEACFWSVQLDCNRIDKTADSVCQSESSWIQLNRTKACLLTTRPFTLHRSNIVFFQKLPNSWHVYLFLMEAIEPHIRQPYSLLTFLDCKKPISIFFWGLLTIPSETTTSIMAYTGILQLKMLLASTLSKWFLKWLQ